MQIRETNAKGEPTGYVLCEIRRSTSSSTLLPSSSPSFSPSSPAPFTSPYSTAEHRAQSPVLIPKWLDTLQQSIDRIEQINNDSDHNQNVTVESIQRFADELHRSLRTERMQNIQTLHRTLDLTERLQRNFDRQMQRLSDQESKVRNGTTSGPAQSTAIESDGVDHRRRHEFARSLLQGYSALLDEQQQPVWRQSEPQKRTQTAERMLDHVLKLIVKLSCNLDPDHVRSEAEQVSADHMLIEAIRLPVKQLSNQFQFPASNTSIDSISHSWIRFPFGLNLTKTLTSDTLNPTVSPWQSCFNHQLHHARPNQSVNHNGQQVAFGALIAHISQHLISRSIEMDDEKSTPSTIDSFVRLDRLVLHQHVIVGSPLLMFNLHRDLNHSHSLPQPVRIELRHLRRLNVGERSVCGFWNVTRGSWDTRGCRLIDFNREATTCECDHLTSFAVLIDIRPTHDPPYSEFWDRVAFACTVISTVGLIATGFIFMCIRRLRRNLRNRITVHLCFCLALINVVVCFGMQWDNVVRKHVRCVCDRLKTNHV